ncbi:hypothetical protein [Plantactinospora sp. BC1]|nr:hypothetical protein [Plantactinospora sp. BC1]
MAGDGTIVGDGRFDTGRDGYAAMRKYASQWPSRPDQRSTERVP